MTHENCGGELVTRPVPKYLAKNLGIDGVEVFDAVEEVRCKKCRTLVETTIPNLPELVAAAALVRVQNPIKLNAREIRFLRKALGWKSVTMAKQLSVAAATVSRWESDEDPAPMGPTNEKVLRMVIVQNLKDVAPGVFVDEGEILSMDIPSVRQTTDTVRLQFWRVLLKENRKTRPAEVWDERVRATG
jgi:DNA-binding transcriptional regulator YiaG